MIIEKSISFSKKMKDLYIPKICDVDEIKPLQENPGYRKILIVKPSSLGDILHAFPAFYLLRKSLPLAKIDWIVNSKLSPILGYIRPDINKVINFRRSEFKKTKVVPKALVSLIANIRRAKYDLVIDMQGLIRSSMMTFAARAKHKAGFAEVKEKGSGIFYDKKISVPREITHAIDKNCFLIASILGIENVVPDFRLPFLSNINITDILTRNKIKKGMKYIAFSPVARWATKTWPSEFFSKAADIITREIPEIKIFLLGTKGERTAVEEIIKNCRYAKPINLSGTTSLTELIELIRGSELLLTNDSGPMHIAAFVRTPVFALFGPTFPEKTGPYWQWHKVYQAARGCIKCAKRNCHRNSLECQKTISAKKVAEDMLKKLYGKI